MVAARAKIVHLVKAMHFVKTSRMNDMKNKKAILIFGTFNPITNAHLYLGIRTKELINDADVIYIPAKDDFLKGWKGMGDESIISNRLSLLKEVTGEYGFLVSSIEVDGVVDGKSINTINYFKNEEGYEEVFFVMGTDKVPELQRWYKSEELVSANRFLVFSRGEKLEDVMTDFTRKYADHFQSVEADPGYADISATRVREALSNGHLEDIEKLVPAKVYEYLSSCQSV